MIGQENLRFLLNHLDNLALVSRYSIKKYLKEKIVTFDTQTSFNFEILHSDFWMPLLTASVYKFIIPRVYTSIFDTRFRRP